MQLCHITRRARNRHERVSGAAGVPDTQPTLRSMRANLRSILTAMVIVTIAATAGCTGKSAPSPAAVARVAFDKAAAKTVAAWPHTEAGAAVEHGVHSAADVHRAAHRGGNDPRPPAGHAVQLLPASRAMASRSRWPRDGHIRGRQHHDGTGGVGPGGICGDVSQSGFRPCNPDDRTETVDSPPCSLTITHIAFGTTTILTSRGMATVPAWLYTTKEVRQPIVRVAVAPSARTIPAVPGHVGVNDTLVTAIDGAHLSLTLITGPGEPGVRARGIRDRDRGRRRLDRHQSDNRRLRSRGDTAPVTVTLHAPLGTRALLDQFGAPVVVGAAYGAGGPDMRF